MRLQYIHVQNYRGFCAYTCAVCLHMCWSPRVCVSSMCASTLSARCSSCPRSGPDRLSHSPPVLSHWWQPLRTGSYAALKCLSGPSGRSRQYNSAPVCSPYSRETARSSFFLLTLAHLFAIAGFLCDTYLYACTLQTISIFMNHFDLLLCPRRLVFQAVSSTIIFASLSPSSHSLSPLFPPLFLANKRSPAWLCDVSTGWQPWGEACSLMWKSLNYCVMMSAYYLPGCSAGNFNSTDMNLDTFTYFHEHLNTCALSEFVSMCVCVSVIIVDWNWN